MSGWTKFRDKLTGHDAVKAQKKNTEAQNRQAAEQHQIDLDYYQDRLKDSAELEEFAQSQGRFARKMETYGKDVYNLAVSDRNRQVDFKNEEVFNKKLGAQTEYKAQETVTDILQAGVEAQTTNVVDDVLRASGATNREVNVASEKMMGVIIAKSQSGVAQGASKDRMVVEAFIQRNAQISKLNDKSKVSILAATNARDKVINDTNLKLAESYRGLQAIMKMEPEPVAKIAPPTPVFTEVPPLPTVAPAGATPVQLDPNASNRSWLSTAGQVVGLGKSIYSLGQ